MDITQETAPLEDIITPSQEIQIGDDIGDDLPFIYNIVNTEFNADMGAEPKNTDTHTGLGLHKKAISKSINAGEINGCPSTCMDTPSHGSIQATCENNHFISPQLVDLENNCLGDITAYATQAHVQKPPLDTQYVKTKHNDITEHMQANPPKSSKDTKLSLTKRKKG